MANYREKGISTLKLVLKQEKNINTLEKALYNKTVSQVEDEDDIEAQYKTNLYQIVCDIQDKEKLKDILENIKKGKIGWEHPVILKWHIKLPNRTSSFKIHLRLKRVSSNVSNAEVGVYIHTLSKIGLQTKVRVFTHNV